MNGSTSVGKRIQNLQIGPEFNTYTMVILHVGQVTDENGNTYDLDFIAGNTTGRTLEVTDPMGSQEKANALLSKLQGSKAIKAQNGHTLIKKYSNEEPIEEVTVGLANAFPAWAASQRSLFSSTRSIPPGLYTSAMQ